MTDLQLFIAIIVPMLFNGALLALLNSRMNARFAALDTKTNGRFASLERRFELLTAKIAELSDRVSRLEVRLEQR